MTTPRRVDNGSGAGTGIGIDGAGVGVGGGAGEGGGNGAVTGARSPAMGFSSRPSPLSVSISDEEQE